MGWRETIQKEQPKGWRDTIQKEKEELSGEVTTEELQGIANKHGLTPAQIKNLEENAAFFGTKIKGKDQNVLEQVPGFISDSVGFGVAQKFLIETADTEQEKNALDDLRQLAEQRKSGWRTAAEIGAGMLVPGGAVLKAAKLGGKAAKAVQAGTLLSAPALEMGAKAKRGEELEGAAKGAALGAVFGTVFSTPAIARAINNKYMKKEVEKSLEERLKKMPNIEAKIDEKLVKNKDTLDIERKALLGEKLSPEEIKTWLGPRVVKKFDENKLEELAEAKLINKFEEFEKFAHKDIGQMEREGKEFMARQYDRFLKDRFADDLLTPHGRAKEVSEKFRQVKRTPEQRAVKKLILGNELTKKENAVVGSATKILEEFQPFRDKVLPKKLNINTDKGKEEVLRTYNLFLKSKLTEEVLVESSLRNHPVALSGIKGLIYKFSDNKPLAKIMDDRLGTNVDMTLDNLSAKHNLYTVALGDSLDKISKLRKITRKSKVDEEALYRALDTGVAEEGVPDKLVKAWKQLFEEKRQIAINMGMPIQKIENYVPKRRKSAHKYVSAINTKAKQIEDSWNYDIFSLREDEFKILQKTKDFKPLLAEMEFLNGGKIPSAREFNTTLNQTIHKSGFARSALAMDAFATKAREGQIPDFVLDKQVGNLASKWTQSTFRTAALRDGVEELRRAASIAEKAGDVYFAKHINDLVVDVIGSRTDSWAAMSSNFGRQIVTKAQIKADAAKDKYSKWMWESVVETPLMVNSMMRMIYPNYIGLNAKSVLQNLATPATFIVPDLGTRYAGKKYLQSFADILDTKKIGKDIILTPEMATKLKVPHLAGKPHKTKSLGIILENAGLLPQQWTGEMVDALQEGIKSGPLRDASRKAIDKYTKGMMFLFEKSETLARSNAYFMGQRIGRDLVVNPSLAEDFLKKIDSVSYQRAFLKSIDSGDVNETQKLMSRYINSNNMFNYDRINMSAYGRFAGPMFSVFTKWPTSIAGRVMSSYERKGLIKGGRREFATLMMPWFTLQALDALTKPEDSPAYDKMVGSKGISGWTAADTLGSVLPDLGKTPIGQAVSGVARAATDKDKKMNTALQEVYNSFGHFSGVLRFMGEDIPMFRGQPRPSGPKIERRIREIQKMLD